MSITITYKCDRCGHEQNDNKQMWEIAISVQHIENTGPIKREFLWLPSGMTIWCRKCCEQVGLFSTWKPEPEAKGAVAAKPTLEEQIREIVRDELEASQ